MNNTYDAQAIEILLSSKSAKQAKLAALAAHAAGERECPYCGAVAVHEDNGLNGCERSYCCTECGNIFDEEEV